MARIDKFIWNAIAKSRRRKYLMIYDISDTREREKVADLGLANGKRIQLSVFELPLTKKEMTTHQIQLDQLNIESGEIKLYRLDAMAKVYRTGKAKTDNGMETEDCYVV
jgi:CRISPR-associated endonuclease Cas2